MAERALILHNTASDLTDKFQALFPTWTSVVATVLAVLILLLVLSKFVYKPVKKMVQDRRNYIQNNIDEAVRQNYEASFDREKANQEIIQARNEAADIISQAKQDAEKVKTVYTAQAKDEANKIVTDAQVEVIREKAKFELESKEAIVNVALAAAAKVIEKEVDNKTNRKIVEDFINSEKDK